MNRKYVLLSATAIAATVVVFIVCACLAWWSYHNSWTMQKVANLFTIAYVFVTALTLIVLTVSLVFVGAQLSASKETERLRVSLTILSRYIEDRDLFETRAFIHGDHMDEINRKIESSMQEASADLQARRGTIGDKIEELSEKRQSLISIELVISTLNQASWLIQRKALTREDAEFLAPPIAAIYPKLRPLIEFEWLRRNDQAHRFANHLVWLNEVYWPTMAARN
jgi:uncharacterized membrane protein